MEKHFIAFSQYDSTVKKTYRPSACGPTAVASILAYYGMKDFSINTLYKKLYCTRLGLPTLFLLFFSKKLLGPQWMIKRITLDSALHELQNNHPVMLKFDRYFNKQFWKKPYFHYHWTVLIDYEIHHDQLFLIVEDLGTPTRSSRRHRIPFIENKHALSFIQFTLNTAFKAL